MIVMKAAHKFMVGVRPVQSVMCLPQCGLRQGDCLSPLILSLYASIFFWQLQYEGLLDHIFAYMYVDEFPTEHDFDLVQRVLHCMECFFIVCGP